MPNSKSIVLAHAINGHLCIRLFDENLIMSREAIVVVQTIRMYGILGTDATIPAIICEQLHATIIPAITNDRPESDRELFLKKGEPSNFRNTMIWI